ncbi:MAG: class I SAM-dependent methyltransferase [Candidatus Neomarinimicrobiota bacterium]|nr:MAG: class I SAM-dependent methyltransferase [Candidatus Neomarinimicrobiota bacterium]
MAYGRWKSLDQVERYARKRYSKLDQRLVDRREKALVRSLLQSYGITGDVLDLPVGYGRFQPLLREFGTVYAGDWGFFPAVYAHERLGTARLSVTCDAQFVPFGNNTMDLVFCFRLMQHMHVREERVRIYRELGRVSRRWVLVSVYLQSVFHTVHRTLFPQPSRITFLRRSEFETELAEAGLRLVALRSVLPGLHGHRIVLAQLS